MDEEETADSRPICDMGFEFGSGRFGRNDPILVSTSPIPMLAAF